MINFWKNKRILITGVHGFVGSNLCKSLVKKGAEVYGLYKNNSSNSLLTIENINNFNKISFINNKAYFLNDLINDKEIEICFHLAAQVEVMKAMEHPFESFKNNFDLTLLLMESFRKSKSIRCIINSSTDKVYGDIDEKMLPYKENYTPIPKYPYEVSKYCAELVANSYHQNYNLPLITTRTANLYGPGQMNFSAIIPYSIKCGLNLEEFIPRSNGKLKRDYLFIEDWINILESLVIKSYEDKKILGELFNFGTNKPLDVISVVTKIYKNLNNSKINKILGEFSKMQNKNEILYQYLDSSKGIEKLNISKLTEFDIGIIKSIDWYKNIFFKK